MKKLDNYYVEFCGKQFSISMVLLWVAVTYIRIALAKGSRAHHRILLG